MASAVCDTEPHMSVEAIPMSDAADVQDVAAAHVASKPSHTAPCAAVPGAARELMHAVIAAREDHELRGADRLAVPTQAQPTPVATEGAVAVVAEPPSGAVVPVTSPAAASTEGVVVDPESLARLLHEARASYARAEAQLDLGLTLCEDWLSLRDCFHDSGALFSICGHHTEAARCLLHATFISRAFGDEYEALTTLNASAENLKQAQPAMAVDVLERLVACYDRAELHMQSAKCLRDAAVIADEQLHDSPRALVLYTRAIDAYDHKMPTEGKLVGMLRSLRDPCFERLCFLHIEQGHYDVAEKMFLEKARQRPAVAPATRFYLSALLCILAGGSTDEDAFFDALYDAKKRFEALQYEDRGLQKGKEQLLLTAIIEACEQNSLNHLDKAWVTYKSYKTTAPSVALDVIMAQIRENLYMHLERYNA